MRRGKQCTDVFLISLNSPLRGIYNFDIGQVPLLTHKVANLLMLVVLAYRVLRSWSRVVDAVRVVLATETNLPDLKVVDVNFASARIRHMLH